MYFKMLNGPKRRQFLQDQVIHYCICGYKQAIAVLEVYNGRLRQTYRVYIGICWTQLWKLLEIVFFLKCHMAALNSMSSSVRRGRGRWRLRISYLTWHSNFGTVRSNNFISTWAIGKRCTNSLICFWNQKWPSKNVNYTALETCDTN